jgi:diguanylate cyclase (GGDEF)-like protein/PAS domain S-box-containing protein
MTRSPLSRARRAASDTRLLRILLRGLRKKSEGPLRTTLHILRAEQTALADGVLVVDEEGCVLTHNDRLLEMWGAEKNLTRESDFLGFALPLLSDPNRFMNEFRAISANRQASRSNEILTLNDGRALSITTLPVVLDDEQTRGRIWYFRDVTTIIRAEQLQAALFRIADISRSARDLNELFSSFHRIVGELMDATNFYIALVDEDSGMLDFPYFVDEIDPAPPRISAKGLTGHVLRTGEALLAGAARVEQMVARGETEDLGAPSVDWLGVPLSSGSRTFGVLVVQSYRESVRFTPRDKEILVFVSQHVAAAIEQKRREQALLESENRYRQMFKNNQAVKMVIDPESGAIVDANPAACAFYDYTSDELRQRTLPEISLSSPDETRAKLQLAAAEKQGYFLTRHRLSSGEIRDVEIHSGPIEVRGRRLIYAIIHDVTERNRAEKALRRSEEHFRSLIENASDMIAIVDVQGTLHYTSPSVERILGYRPQSITGSNIYDCAHPEDMTAVAKALTEAFEGISSDNPVEIRIRHQDGAWRTIEGMTHRLDRESGERLVVNSRDVTDRKHTEAVLHTHSAALEASMDGIAIINERGEFNYVNHAFLKLFGYRNRTDLIGQRWTLVQTRRSYPRLMKEILPSFLVNGEWRGESHGRRRDGHSFPIEVSMTRIGSGSAVCVIRDITERALAEEQIKHLAYHDALTNLPNRLLFQDRLTVALQHAQREVQKLAVLFLDLDRFKVINDSMGHDAGDSLLQEVAKRLQRCVRESDTVSRMGGDEFTVLLTNIGSSDDATRIARKILDAIRQPFRVTGREVHTSTSVGISLYPEDGSEAESLLKTADMAMYQAKELGRNNYQLFNAQVNARNTERMQIENDLRQALARREFVLHYQPIFDLRNGRIHGMEALIRWAHPELGLVSPAQFIPVAEGTGLMVPVGEWVLETACIQTREWHARGYGDLSVAVNLSVAQLQQHDLVERVKQILADTGLRASYLELEITESGAMQRPDSSIRALEQLRALGIRISLDDFGTGHSSLSHLKRFPIDTLKIDQSFIRDISDDPDTAAIVTGIIAMGHTLRMKVVGEGVELDVQRQFLFENRCDFMQGFLFHPPVPADAFERLLAQEGEKSGQWARRH